MNIHPNQITDLTLRIGKTLRALAGAGAVIASALLSFAAHAVPGDTDPFFGTNGRVISRISNTATNEVVRDAVLQPDGKIVTVGTCTSGSGATRFCVTRHTAGGTLDSTFGDVSSGGTAILISSDENYATAVALQRDGKIIVGGYCGASDTTGVGNGYDICLVKLLPNGKLDLSFGTAGVLRQINGGDQILTTLVLRPDERIVVGGSSELQGAKTSLLAFYLPNGAADSSPANGSLFTLVPYGSGGSAIQSIAFSNETSVYNTTTQLETPAVYFAGQSTGAANLDFFVGYYWTGLGGSNPSTVIPMGNGIDVVRKLIQLPDKSLAAVGYCNDGTRYVFCATRTDDFATLNGEFGTGGKVLLPAFSSTGNYAYSVLAQPDGKLVLAGDCAAGVTSKFCLARLNQDGSLDKTFGANGAGYSVSAAGTGNGDSGRKVMIRPNGALVIAGTCTDGTRQSFCLEQYQGGPFAGRYCSLDLDGDGIVQATTDLLIASRIAAGITGPSVVAGIGILGKPRGTWKEIREYLNGQCGMSIAQ
jgi:uncharacterized delta-60 repeat protein